MNVRSSAYLAAVLLAPLGLVAAPASAAAGPRPPHLARTAPVFAATTATVFTVTTTADSGLATATGTACVDAADGECSLRAAVEAADNLGTPVRIVLGATTYPTMASALVITNPAGTEIDGQGAGQTAISAGHTSRVLIVGPASSTTPAGELYLTGTTISEGAASGDGGGIDVQANQAGGTAVLDHDVITDDTATGHGGGVSVEGASAAFISNTTIDSNVAQLGGSGLYVDGASARIRASAIDDNTAPATSSGGAGIYDHQGVVEVEGGSISSDTVGAANDESCNGGGITDISGQIHLTGVTVDHDSGCNGGGIYAQADVVDVTGGSLSNDIAFAAGTDDGEGGGGAYLHGSGELALHGVKMTADLAPDLTGTGANGGGAIADYGTGNGNQLVVDGGTKITEAGQSAIDLIEVKAEISTTINDSTISHSSDDLANSSVSGNSCGGAICGSGHTAGSINLAMSGDRIIENDSTDADSSGGSGGVSLGGAGGSSLSAELTGDEFRGNSAGAGGFGGAIGANSTGVPATSVDVRTEDDTFLNNKTGTATTTGNGGAIAIDTNSSYRDTGSEFSGNRSLGTSSAGGAIYDNSSQAMSLAGSNLTSNSAAATGGLGGGIWSDDQGGVRLDGVTLLSNESASGGAYYAAAGEDELDLTNSTLAENTAGTSTLAGQGGGIYLDSGLLATTNSTIADNTAISAGAADGQGGGLWLHGSGADLSYTTVTGNIAASGGGAYFDGDGGALLASIVAGNRTSPGGAQGNCVAAQPNSNPLSAGGNVLSQRTCVAAQHVGDIITTHPGLRQVLTANGGGTDTIGLTPTSPAINLGGAACPATDQRGVARTASHCDAGAYQRVTPRISRLGRTHGHAGQKVTLHGTGLAFAQSVHFGATKARITSDSATTIVAVIPAHRAGAIDVVVTTPDGTSKPKRFTYSKTHH